MTYRELHLMMKTVKFSKRLAYRFPNIVLALTFLLKVFTTHVFCVPKFQITLLKPSNSPLVGNYPQVKNLWPRAFHCLNPALVVGEENLVIGFSPFSTLEMLPPSPSF